MFKSNKKIQERLNKIFYKIAEFDLHHPFEWIQDIYEEEVLEGTLPRSSSIHNSIEFALMLISQNKISNLFWKSYAQTYLVSSSQFHTNLSISDVKTISSLLAKESKSNEDLNATLHRFERFIGTNGLLKNFSKNFIEFNPTLLLNNIGAIATLDDSDELLQPIIFHGKSMLCKIIFNIYGLKVVAGNGIDEFINSKSIKKTDIDYLIKRGLIKDVDSKYKENIKKIFDGVNFNDARREYVHSYVQTKELLDKISLESYGFKDSEDDLELHAGLNDILAFNAWDTNFETVDDINSAYWYANIIQGTAKHAIDTLRNTIKYKYNLFHNSHEKTIPIEGLTMLAGLSNQDSIRNILNESKSKLKKRIIKNRQKSPKGSFIYYESLEIECKSAIEWLRDSKRRYKIYELIEDIKPMQNVDYDYFHAEINKAKKNIEQSKKKSKPFTDNDIFVRTDKEIFGRVADHNKKRWEWIGKGKTFKELNAKNSVYRKNIDRKTYKKHTSPITQDILYDLKSGYIKKIN